MHITWLPSESPERKAPQTAAAATSIGQSTNGGEPTALAFLASSSTPWLKLWTLLGGQPCITLLHIASKSKQSGIYGVNLRINLLPFVMNGLSPGPKFHLNRLAVRHIPPSAAPSAPISPKRSVVCSLTFPHSPGPISMAGEHEKRRALAHLVYN